MPDQPPARPTLQGNLFSPMCAESVALQRDLFSTDPPRPAGPRIPDLPGQTFIEELPRES
jgi:hypothetical protein